MKTVTGKITKSTPVTIAKAASILSKFVSADTGASQALNAYLRRATAAFDELARLHSKSDRRKHKRDSAPDQRVEASQPALVNDNEQRLKMEVKEEGNAAEEETGRRRKTKKKRKKKREEERSNEVKKEKIQVEVNEGKVVGKVENKVEKELKKKKKKKKRKRNSGEVEVEVKEGEKEGKDGLKDEEQRKKKRRRKHEDEN